MKIAVIGAGIVGVTTAYELATDGHEVTVFERRGTAAEEASFANAGIVAPGYVTPWATPGLPLKVLSQLFGRSTPVKLRWPLSLTELAWLWKFYRACKLETYLASRARMHTLACFSRERLHQLTRDLKLDYDRSEGYLILLRAEQDRKQLQSSLQVLTEAGIAWQELSMEIARKIEPALNPAMKFHSAINVLGDEVGNCREFALLLKNEAQAKGVNFVFNSSVTRIDMTPALQLQIQNSSATQAFDAVVVCAGLASAQLLKPLGLKIPMAAVYGYSVSASVREPLNAPRSAVMDERYKVAISRLGNRIRVAGSAEIGGSQHHKPDNAIKTLYKVLNDWFPGAAQHSNGIQIWKGARPMLPDGPPLLGASGIPGLWLNCGHGSSGWALSCGSARAVADLITQNKPAIDLTGFGIERLTA